MKILIDLEVEPDNYTNPDEVVREVCRAIDKHIYGVWEEGRTLGVKLRIVPGTLKVKTVKPRKKK